MRNYLFSRARKILLSGRVIREGISSNAEYFVVETPEGKKYNAYLQYTDNGDLKYNCDCKFMSVQGIPRGTFCAHILAIFCWKIWRTALDELKKQ